MSLDADWKALEKCKELFFSVCSTIGLLFHVLQPVNCILSRVYSIYLCIAVYWDHCQVCLQALANI